MTAWLSNSNLSGQGRHARGINSPVLFAALAVLVAIALYLIMSAGHPIAQDAAGSLAGP
jgi:hypothetical protein